MKKDLFWIENELHGFERVKDKIKEKDIPEYRIIKTEIRIKSDDQRGYTPIVYNLTLGHPIWQVEEWVKKAEKSESNELVLTGPVTQTFKKVHRDTFNTDPPQEEIPYIINLTDLKRILNELKINISKFLNKVEKKRQAPQN